VSDVLLRALRPTRPDTVVHAVWGAIAAAWVALVVHDVGPAHDHNPVGGVAAWFVMVVAMMGPAVLPAVRHVVDSSLRWRRPRAVAEFLGVYVGGWMLFGLAAVSIASALGQSVGLAACALATAALWQVTPYKWRAMIDCHRAVPLPPTGRRASVGCLTFGAVHASACVRSCWPAMAVMAVAPGPHVLWCTGLLPVVLHERLAPRPRRAARTTGAALAAAALLVGLPLAVGA
jgi:predicted metal-binding membrane protein